MRWDQETGAETRESSPEGRSVGWLALRRAGMGAAALVLASVGLLTASPTSAQEAGAPEADTGHLGEDSGTEPSQPQAEDQTDPEYQFNLGIAYFNGVGVLQDQEEAVRWWRLAAEQGRADAQQMLDDLQE